MSVGQLLAMPSAKGLFNQAILQSGVSNTVSASAATKDAKDILALLGVGFDELSKLEQISVEQLQTAASSIAPRNLLPVVDGVFLPQHPLEALTSGCASEVSILIGTNLDEARYAMIADPTWRQLDEEGLKHRCEQMVGPFWPMVSPYYMDNERGSGQTILHRLMSLLTYSMFTVPALQMAERQVKQGASVWMYRFDWSTPVLGGELGACHAVELPFVWNNLNNPEAVFYTGSSPERQNLADQMHAAWIAFALSGSPATPEIPVWPCYDLTSRATMIFHMESTVENDPAREERQVWESIATNR